MTKKELVIQLVDDLQDIKAKEFYSFRALAPLVKVHVHTLTRFLKHGKDTPLLFHTPTLRAIKKFIDDYNKESA